MNVRVTIVRDYSYKPHIILRSLYISACVTLIYDFSLSMMSINL